MATVYMYSGGELVRTFERVDDDSVARAEQEKSLTFKFFDLGEEEVTARYRDAYTGADITHLDNTHLDKSALRAGTTDIPMPRGAAPPAQARVPGMRRATLSADWCVIYEPGERP